MNNRTLAIIKPDAVSKNYIGQIVKMINDGGFKILRMKMVCMSKKSAEGFYEIHKERPFFVELIEFMTSGPCVPIPLEKENAVEDYRKLIGATNPAEAEEGTIRKLYAESLSKNAVHGSDSDENAVKEIAHFFSRDELLNNK
ncbi:MAG: nucleoside-diphosphate kinase [Bacteroidetes bacterium]|nr:nucleoside-diphosphate kinase [Bacteroidota bacterium]